MQRHHLDDRYAEPVPPPLLPPTTAQRVRRIGGAVLSAAVTIAVTVVVTRPDPDAPAAVAGAISATVQHAGDGLAADPVGRALAGQATALLRGDRAGWLAAVDPARPALRKRYQGLYAALRGLRITGFAYHLPTGRPAPGDEPVTVDIEIAFCFNQDPCPAGGSARIAQSLTLRPARTGHVITAVATAAEPSNLQPVPWEAGDLVVAEGDRVSVGAPPDLAGRLREAVQVADLAAAVNDRYAVLVGNPQRRYRVFLANAKTWSRWYGAGLDDWAAGYTQPLGDAEADVVVDVSELADRDSLREVIQHELAHVVTVGGVNPPDHWLAEGIAEYIGTQPRPAEHTYSAMVLTGLKPPASIVPEPIGRGSGEDRAAEFYALAHYAVECLATKYGEPAMLAFIRLRLREGRSRDEAAGTAFGRSFGQVDKACTAWIGRRTG